MAGGESADFAIRLKPTGLGVRLATVTINSNDADENPYTFSIAGVGIAGPYKQGGSPDFIVSMEAEGYHANDPGQGVYADEFWTIIQDANASGGLLMRVPTTNVTVADATPTLGPRLVYEIEFTTTGSHSLWVRSAAAQTNGGDDSIYVPFNGVQVGTRFNLPNASTLGWTKFGTTFNVPSVGKHVLAIHLREDGAGLDKILVTKNSGLPTPTGDGPATSSFGALSGYDLWASAFDWLAGDSTPGADRDGDGFINEVEFAMDLNPLVSDADLWAFGLDDTQTYLVLPHRRSNLAVGFNWSLQSSNTLEGGSWTPLAVDNVDVFLDTLNANVDGDGSASLLQYRVKLSSITGSTFLRLHID